jgi:hypothetical protein
MSTQYTLEDLMAMDNDALVKAAKRAFLMQFDPFSELGKRTMKRRLMECQWVRTSKRMSPALATIIGEPSQIIDNILDYQEAQLTSNRQSANV